MGWSGPTYRQHVVANAWLDLQWNEPGRLEWYLMRLMAETVNCQLSKGAKPTLPEQYKLVFEFKRPLTEEEEAAAQSNMWLKAVGATGAGD